MNTRAWKWWQIDAAGVAVIGVLSLIFYAGGLRPLVQHYQAGVSQRSELASRRAQAISLDSQLASLRNRLVAMQQAVVADPVRLAPASSVNQRLAELSNLATESGLKINEIEPGRPLAGTHYQKVPVNLVGNGTYRTCTMFLNRLRRTFPDTSVVSFDLTAKPGDPAGSGAFRFSLEWHASPEQALTMR